MTFDELVDKVFAYRQQVCSAYAHLPQHEIRIAIYLSNQNSLEVLDSGRYSTTAYGLLWHEYVHSRMIMGYPVYPVANIYELTHPEYQIVLLIDPMAGKPIEYVGDKDEINAR